MAPGDVIGIAQNSAGAGRLMQKDIALCINILPHVLMMVQMVRRHVRHHRHVGRLVHADELKAGELHHSHVRRSYLFHHRQQGAAQVSAQMHSAPCGLQHLGNQRGGGRLSVRARHRHLFTGAQLKKQLHLTGHFAARSLCGLKLWREIFKAGVRMMISCPARPSR